MRIIASYHSSRMPSTPLRGVLWALFSALFSALFMIPWKLASQRGSASVTVWFMVLFAALGNGLLYPLVLRGRRRWSQGQVEEAEVAPRWGSRQQWTLALVLSVCTVVGNVMSARSIAQVSAPILSVIQRTEVLWITLLSFVVIGERADARFWLGVFLAACGVWMLHPGANAVAELQLSGVVYGVLSAMVFSVMAVLTRKYIKSVDPVRLNAQRLLLSVPLWFVMGTNPRVLFEVDAGQVFYAALAGLFGPVLSRLCLMQSARHVDARITAMAVQLAPLMTVGLAFAAFGEIPAAHELAGGALMLLGVVASVAPIGRRVRL